LYWPGEVRSFAYPSKYGSDGAPCRCVEVSTSPKRVPRSWLTCRTMIGLLRWATIVGPGKVAGRPNWP
jgi:hypothetical protein